MAGQLANVDRTTALFERPAMGVQDETAFAAVKQAIAERYAAQNVEEFLRAVESGKMRIREFEAVLESHHHTLLGPLAKNARDFGCGLPLRSRPQNASTLERETGIEPATNSLEGCDSTTELLPRAATHGGRG